jgi:serine O-acetyltransferase
VEPGGESEIKEMPPSHDVPLPKGDRNENPRGIGLLALLAEDYRTHDRDLLEPGFWAVAVHRFGNARMGIRFKLLRAPLTVVYRLMFTAMNWFWGINLPYNAKLGRRVRIWHHGGMWLGARSIGDDVHIRHNTTFGLLSRSDVGAKPIIGNRVDVGVGACILGAVTVGDDCVIGPNSVVIRDLPPGSVVMGVPARQTALWKDGASPTTPPKPESLRSKESSHG